MKIGLRNPFIDPQMGGGFTVEQDIFETLIRNAASSKHEFVVFGAEAPSMDWAEYGNVTFVPAKWAAMRKLRSFAIVAINNFIERILGCPRVFSGEGWLDTLIWRENIDMFLNISQPSYLAPVPYVAIQWDLQHRLQPQFPEVSSGGRWQRQERNFSDLLRRASYVVCGTNVGRLEMEYFYQIPTNRIKVIPLPVPSYVRNIQKENSATIIGALPTKRPFLLYPAQFWPHKNHVNLLMALQKVRTDCDFDLDLVLVGSDKGNANYVRSIAAELGLTSHVHFLGFVKREQLVALYKEAFALCYVSFFGPDNLPPLEAFALGCPVVASRWSGADEQLQDAALFVDGADPDSIAMGIAKLHHNPHYRNELIRKGTIRAAGSSALGYVNSLFEILDAFSPVRRNWGNGKDYRVNYTAIAALKRLLRRRP